jgi:hypothetical protein
LVGAQDFELFPNYLLLMACDVSWLRLIFACLPTEAKMELACSLMHLFSLQEMRPECLIHLTGE